MKLLECAMGKDIKRRTFEFSGELTRIEVENGYVEIEADNLHIIETTGGTRVDFEPKGKTWQGKNIDSEYAMLDVISRYSRNETVGFEMLYLCESLQQFLDDYTKDVSLTFAGRDIPYKVLGGPSFAEYPLIYATDQYLYYAYDPDAVLMIKTDTGELVSDNYFAEMGLYDSQEAVDAGTEKLLEFKEFE